MVEYAISLDSVFASLADPTRRDILRRISNEDLTVGELAKPYDLSFAAVSKHLKVLERARLIIKRRRGKEQLVSIAPEALKSVDEYLDFYRKLWEGRLDRLEAFLEQEQLKENKKGTN
jgi:DNA-binding transcriptional ArsR family regulator